MSEETAIDYAEIKDWLRECGYSFDVEDAQGKSFVSNYEGSEWFGWYENDKAACKHALNHWLTGELGRKWAGVGKLVLASKDCPFGEGERAAIFTAIYFYEALDKAS